MGITDTGAIKLVIEKAYIRGIHGDQDEGLVWSGFHEGYEMLVLGGNGLDTVAVEEWLARVEGKKRQDPEMWSAETRYTFDLVDASGNTAVVKLQVYQGETQFSTDYMLPYRFEEGWRIVSKIFAIPSWGLWGSLR